ncbi:hypothetical protein [Methylotenera sp. N17]|uniref:hypothetical protein n=1 Tax=Methylotenera sp. N17 TaxID=1502761 RepID=UPI000647ABE2|nr:hypothetical protein [Methylotenera sp. N17]
MKNPLTIMTDYFEELMDIDKLDIDKSESDKLKFIAYSKMNLWTFFDLHRLVGKSIKYENNYYTQIHDMPKHFMIFKELQKRMPIIPKEKFSIFIDENDKNKYLSDLKNMLDSEYQKSCLNGMDSTYMYPEEIMSNIDNLLKMKPDDAFESLEISTMNLLALKLDKQIPRKNGIQEKISKI